MDAATRGRIPFRVGAARALARRCPVCGIGAMFERWYTTRRRCASCGFAFEREQGYFIGAMYVNYGATIGIVLAGFFSIELATGIATERQIIPWLIFALVFPAFFFPFSRALWLAFDLSINAPAECELAAEESDREHDQR